MNDTTTAPAETTGPADQAVNSAPMAGTPQTDLETAKRQRAEVETQLEENAAELRRKSAIVQSAAQTVRDAEKRLNSARTTLRAEQQVLEKLHAEGRQLVEKAKQAAALEDNLKAAQNAA